MESRVAAAMRLEHQPVALLWSDDKPEGATQFKPGKWGCVMWLFASAAEGKVAACDRETFGCFGGGVGMGFGDQYRKFPGGEECFCRFLSTGNEASAQGRLVAANIKPFVQPEMHEEFLEGERYLKTPEATLRFLEQLPITDIPSRYVVLKALKDVAADAETPKVVVFLANPDQLSALVVLANYEAPTNENVIIPFAAGCQSIGIDPFREAASDTPRAVAGLVDLSARLQLKRRIGSK